MLCKIKKNVGIYLCDSKNLVVIDSEIKILPVLHIIFFTLPIDFNISDQEISMLNMDKK